MSNATILWCIDTLKEGGEISIPQLTENLTLFFAHSKGDVLKLLHQYPQINLVLISVTSAGLKGLLPDIRALQDHYRSVAFVTTIEECLRAKTVEKVLDSLTGVQAHKRKSMDFRFRRPSYSPEYEEYEPLNTNETPYTRGDLGHAPIADSAIPGHMYATRLTPRQRDVLTLIMRGKSNKQIARILDLTEGTVKIHCMAIFRQLGVTNRTQAALIGEQLLDVSQNSAPYLNSPH